MTGAQEVEQSQQAGRKRLRKRLRKSGRKKLRKRSRKNRTRRRREGSGRSGGTSTAAIALLSLGLAPSLGPRDHVRPVVVVLERTAGSAALLPLARRRGLADRPLALV